MKGIVKFFSQEKEFGFIAADDGKEVFVHKSALDDGVTIDKDDKVTFDVEEGDRGPKAVNVKKEGSAEAEDEEEDEEEAEEEETEMKEAA
ncbi:MAG: cold shock domain-containing protein [Nanoarchaeota archaeon]|nr:cold shock domain-containing protein [Nanoarchaeota archaeon]